MDPRNHLAYQKFLEIGTLLMVLWFLSFSAFILASYYDAQPFVQPLIFVIFLILFLINPIRIFWYNARIWFLKKLGQVFLAPFYHVDFVGFWLGDQLTSLELIFFDIEFFICFYIYDANWGSTNKPSGAFCSGWSQYFLQTFFILLPSWFRFAQCLRRYRDTKHKFPHLANAGKYASGFFTAITNTIRRATNLHYNNNKIVNPYLYLWFVTSFIGATYKFIWDLKMDWGFFDKNAGENKYLREQIVYPSKIYYYAAIIEDFILRYIWVINVFIYFRTPSAEYADIIGFAFGIVEVIRRFIWNFFRLENEHLNNCGEFRAVRDISIRATPTDNNYLPLEEMNFQGQSARISKQRRLTSAQERTATSTVETEMTVVNETSENGTVLRNSSMSTLATTEQIADEINAMLPIDPFVDTKLLLPLDESSI
ncbi:unnamed protein product [Didymodactylos carnosus]|uniref:EXS domain-containing protein n=1 Tax=Didymodactylos carnosus TaxID=1234261 RepID=A0A814H7H3_9BILA|nr:unnamed protein product [Didymodactylos carnosus]CAF3778134.1 unnamed protein product [Didymodactylos carnosus]